MNGINNITDIKIPLIALLKLISRGFLGLINI